jgi:hypothetical protein
MIKRRTPGLLLTIMAIAVLALPLCALAQTDQPRSITIRVDSVLAANTGKGMDASLSSSVIGSRLKALFEYTTYRLVMHQQQQTVCGRMVTFEMPGGRILHIAPNSVLDNMISMELVLFEGTRPLMTTDLKLMNHAVLIVGGPRYHEGMLITMISTDVSEHRSRHRLPPDAIPPSPTSGAGPIPANSASPQH